MALSPQQLRNNIGSTKQLDTIIELESLIERKIRRGEFHELGHDAIVIVPGYYNGYVRDGLRSRFMECGWRNVCFNHDESGNTSVIFWG